MDFNISLKLRLNFNILLVSRNYLRMGQSDNLCVHNSWQISTKLEHDDGSSQLDCISIGYWWHNG